MNKPLDALLQKEMSRKEFLAALGFGVASIMGFSTIIHLLSGKSTGSRLQGTKSSFGYGSSAYGGGRDNL